MAEYIDRDKLLWNRPEMRNPNYEGKEEYHAGWNACCGEIYYVIKNAPTEDVVPKSEIANIFEEIEQEAYKNEEGDLYLDLPDYLKIKKKTYKENAMPRYIDLDMLMEQLESQEPMNWTDSEAEIQEQADYQAFKNMIENQPIADVVPRSEYDAKAKQEVAKEILDKIGIAFKKIEPSYIDEYFETVLEDFTTEFNKIYDEYVNS